MKFLSKRDSEKLIKHTTLKIDVSSYVLVEHNKRYYIVSQDIKKIDLTKLNIKQIGLYLGAFEEHHHFVVSAEAKDLFPDAQ